MLLNCGVGEDSWESLGLQGDPTSPSYRKSVLNNHWRGWCWSWNSSILATSCRVDSLEKTLMLEGLGAGEEGDGRWWDGWMVSLTQWTWVWVNYRSWWWTGRPGVLQSMGSQRVGHNWLTELNWTELNWCLMQYLGDIYRTGRIKPPRRCPNPQKTVNVFKRELRMLINLK